MLLSVKPERTVAFVLHTQNFIDFLSQKHPHDSEIQQWIQVTKQTFADVFRGARTAARCKSSTNSVPGDENPPPSVCIQAVDVPLPKQKQNEENRLLYSRLGQSSTNKFPAEGVRWSAAGSPFPSFSECPTQVTESSVAHSAQPAVSGSENETPMNQAMIPDGDVSDGDESPVQPVQPFSMLPIQSKLKSQDPVSTSGLCNNPISNSAVAQTPSSLTTSHNALSAPQTTPTAAFQQDFQQFAATSRHRSIAPAGGPLSTSCSAADRSKNRKLLESEVESKMRQNMGHGDQVPYANYTPNFDTVEDCIETYCCLQKFLNKDRSCIIRFCAMQGEAVQRALVMSDNDFDKVHGLLIKRGMDYSSAHLRFLVRLHRLLHVHTRLTDCRLPLRFFMTNFRSITNVCEKSDEWR